MKNAAHKPSRKLTKHQVRARTYFMDRPDRPKKDNRIRVLCNSISEGNVVSFIVFGVALRGL